MSYVFCNNCGEKWEFDGRVRPCPKCGIQKTKRLKLSPREYHVLKMDLFKLQAQRCHNCSDFIQRIGEGHLHHIKRRSQGGDDSIENCCIL